MFQNERRLQKIGSSILMSLPAEWIKTLGLKKGDILSIENNDDKSITIFPTSNRNSQAKEIAIHLLDLSHEKLINQIYGAYLLGYDIIKIVGRTQIDFENREIIKKAMRNLIGLEIVDEDGLNMTIQFLLDAHSMNISKILKQMSSIVSGMHKDIVNAMKTRDSEIDLLVRGRDDEVNRQYFLIVRLIRTAMMDRRLASSLDLSNIDILDYRIAANHLENAGDFISRLSSQLSGFFDKIKYEKIIEANYLILEMQEKSISGFITKDTEKSSHVVTLFNKFDAISTFIKNDYIKLEGNYQSALKIINIIYTMDDIARCWVDITDLIKPVYSIR
ncbi:MAG: phosphate uptake regulator PhoU [Nitrososphaeraceae archaeon]|jgi:phosphate uptake regulator|nr:phosphate uptake regulator PhoU [Nitrososphaeraceae archaeon]MDW0144040.1 phosphate uptake regulator PhoU [Nitrososphaeraceae archaeon]MDW0148010.1 phosphate uptake regulator PhoU [Nitrososphaeraceae archaeon]MDW0154057.1 phosphate uptake regulator PhoU [Nitrososphaeraceae archaeon]